jgi:hypothetical protein
VDKNRDGMPEHNEGFATSEAIGEMAGGQFREAGEAVRNALDGAKPRRARSDRSQESGEDGGSGFMAPVGEQAGETDAEDGAVQPMFVFSVFGACTGSVQRSKMG